MVARFERASDAVVAALAFQERQSIHIAKFDDGINPRLRIGIALGEVIVDSRVMTGVGVVLAQRAEQLALPDGLCITAAIHEALPKRMPFELESLGYQELKGFAETIRIYRVTLIAGETIPSNYESIRQGARTFQKNCTTCHGDNADGSGVVGLNFDIQPANLRALAKSHKDGEFAYKIRKGRGDMPAWEIVLSETDIWNLVNYIKNLDEEFVPVKGENGEHDHPKMHRHAS